MKLCIVIPAYDEEEAIALTIADYKMIFNEAIFVIIDNNSKDKTAETARKYLDLPRDHLLFETRQGKGAAVKAGLGRVAADVYVMTDADNTYTAADAKDLVDVLLDTRCDMVVGDRVSEGAYAAQNERRGHSFGNHFLTRYVSLLAGQRYRDVLSGLRVMSRPFVSMLDVQSSGFQLETELNITAAYVRASVIERPIDYRPRPEGSVSKLSTWTDGLRIGRFALINWIAFYPLLAFGLLSCVAFVASGALGVRVISIFLETGEMPYVSSAVAAAAAGLVALQALFSGLILHVGGQIERRRDVARLLERRRRWNETLDKCISTDSAAC